MLNRLWASNIRMTALLMFFDWLIEPRSVSRFPSAVCCCLNHSTPGSRVTKKKTSVNREHICVQKWLKGLDFWRKSSTSRVSINFTQSDEMPVSDLVLSEAGSLDRGEGGAGGRDACCHPADGCARDAPVRRPRVLAPRECH